MDLKLGKDQSANRGTPQAYEKVGESSTRSVRKTLLAMKYAENSKIFTVKDSSKNEVLLNGKAGNTKDDLSDFTQSPVKFMLEQSPDDGNYVFIGAVNADYHSFTIVLNKESESNVFTFIDQYYIRDLSEIEIELYLLTMIGNYRENFPMKLELYQLKNTNK